jgi:hypothetical protein
MEKAETGDFKALRKLQADLRVKGEKAQGSDFLAENDIGDEIIDVKDQINKDIENHLRSTGNDRAANALNKVRKDYREIQKTYFSTPALAKVFGKSQSVPKNPLTLLTTESTEMKNFFKAHPEVEKMMQKALKHKDRASVAKVAGGVIGGGSVAGGVSHMLNKK